MTRVTLAYEYEGHAPDETIDVDEATASRLVHEGKARVAEGEDVPASVAAAEPTTAAGVETGAEDYDALTVDELQDRLRARDLPVSGTKAELVDRLRTG